MSKTFRINGERYGGELTIGKVSQEFYDHFKDKDPHDLEEKAFDYDNEMGPSFNGEEEEVYWHDIDDIEHSNGIWIDCELRVHEIDEKGEEIDDTEFYVDLDDCTHVYSRECYLDTHEAGTPAVTYFSAEKGHFWYADVECEEFDKSKLMFGSVETDLANLVETIAYDGKELELNYDDYSSTGKGFEAKLGMYNPQWHEKYDSYDIETVIKEEYSDEL